MPIARRIPLLPLSLFWVALVLGVPGTARSEVVKDFHYAEVGYVQIDPRLVSTPNDERLALALGDCLTILDPVTGKAGPGAAERWETAADGRTWTFHLRDAVWSDSKPDAPKPVKAGDFVYAWARILEPNNKAIARQLRLFRSIQGCAAIEDAYVAMTALDDLSKAIGDMAQRNPAGIPGDQLAQAIDDAGARPFAAPIQDPNVQRLLKWGSDPMPPEKVDAARKAIRAEKKKHKDALQAGLDEFGKKKGAIAKDDKTLVVVTDGWRPYLPEILARAAFLPLRADRIEGRDPRIAFEPSEFVGQGPYLLRGRGPKPLEGEKAETVVHLARNPLYKGPQPGLLDEIRSWTDLGMQEDMRRFGLKQMQWVANVGAWRGDVAWAGWKEREKHPAFRTRLRQSVLCLKFRPDNVGPGKDKDGKEIPVRAFEKLEARKAFALCLDRAAAAKLCWPGAEPAFRILPSGVRGAAPNVAAPSGKPTDAPAAYASLGIKPDDFPWLDVFHADDPDVIAILNGPSGSDKGGLAGAWTKMLKVDSSLHVDTGTEAPRLAIGKFAMVVEERTGDWNDPSAFLDAFHSRHPGGQTGWKDEVLDALLEGALDPDAFAKAPNEKALAAAQDAAGLKTKAEAAKSGSADAKEALRLALYGEAEQRLLSQYVVVPIVQRREAELVQDVKGLGGDDAWKNPAFFGSLRAATR